MSSDVTSTACPCKVSWKTRPLLTWRNKGELGIFTFNLVERESYGILRVSAPGLIFFNGSCCLLRCGHTRVYWACPLPLHAKKNLQENLVWRA
jgi:hypothetical protein